MKDPTAAVCVCGGSKKRQVGGKKTGKQVPLSAAGAYCIGSSDTSAVQVVVLLAATCREFLKKKKMGSFQVL